MDELTEGLEELILKGSVDERRWQGDDMSTRMAAGQARLPYNKLSDLEEGIFSDLLENKSLRDAYLMIRNQLLLAWTQEPNVELTVEMAQFIVFPSLWTFRKLIRRVHGFLTRHGYINFGFFHSLRAPSSAKKKTKVVVIGAGAAGLAAASQLTYFGFDVEILEARSRTGGRLQTCVVKKPNSENVLGVADLGAMIITGIHRNPMVTLMKQIHCEPVHLKTACPIYDETGRPIDRTRDHLVERAFRDVGDAFSYLVRTGGFTKTMKMVDGEAREHEFLSFEKGYDLVLEQMELKAQRNRCDFWTSCQDILNKIEHLQQEILLYTQAVNLLVAKGDRLENVCQNIQTQNEVELVLRLQCFALSEAFRRLDAAKERRLGLVTTLKDLKKHEPSAVYMNAKDRRLLDFHYANLEYANGTSLENLSAEHWDQDDKFQMQGSHMAVAGGYGAFMEKFAEHVSRPRMATRTTTHLSCIVTDVIYGEHDVKIKYHKGEKADEILEMTADAVVVTTPLGVLKKEEEFRFEPPLPEAKRAAIRAMGFGNLNKVVLFFEKTFWNTEQNFFGHLNPSSESRGEFFLFMSVECQPILIALMSGHAAELDQPNQLIVNNAMAVLQGIFGSQIPKTPVDAVVTRWHTDKFAYGCYSHIPPGGCGQLYDELASPVCARAADGSHSGAKRLFFAGEHTFKKSPASVPGAWLSGIRAAAVIADEFLGVPFSAKSVAEESAVVIELEEDSDVEIVNLDDSEGDNEPAAAPVNDDDDIIPMDPKPTTPPREEANEREVVPLNGPDDEIQIL